MVRGKNYGNIFFCSCLKWRAKYLWLRIQTCDPSRFDYSTFVILLLTSYFIASKWWPISERNNLMFFSARKFRQRLDSEVEVVTF